MIYFILPPIIILACASALAVFLFKKTKEIPHGELAHEQESCEYPRGGGNKVLSAVGHFGLKILERIIHKVKLLALKFHNISNEWFHSIREKRQRSILQARQNEQESLRKNESEEEVRQEEMVGVPVYPSVEKSAILKVEEKLEPILKKTVTHPQRKAIADRKSQLEDVLIRRIAINPRDIEAYERLGDYYMEQENNSDALECYRQVIKLSPMHSKARAKVRRLEKIAR